MILTNYKSYPAFYQMVSFMVVPKYARHGGFVTKHEENGYASYNFISKNNFLYGSGGVVFCFVKSKEADDCIEYMDDGVDLGEAGGYHYYMGKATDVQCDPYDKSLGKEWRMLDSTYQEIVDSFSAE